MGLLQKEIRIHQRTNLNLEGTVQAVDLDLSTVTVLDVVFEISNQTKMEDESDTGERFFDLADLTVSDFVEIKGFIDNEGHNIATKMKRENESRGQQGFIRVHDQGDIDYPARQECGEEFGKPQNQARHPDREDAPEHRKVVKSLPIRPAVELGTRTFAEEPLLVRDEIA